MYVWEMIEQLQEVDPSLIVVMSTEGIPLFRMEEAQYEIYGMETHSNGLVDDKLILKI